MNVDDARRPCVIVAGGIDPSGGAGLGVDALAVAAGGAHPVCVATGVAVQDHEVFRERVDLPTSAVRSQLAAAAASAPGALKAGMLGTAETTEVLAAFCTARPRLPIVLDPVRRTSSGGVLLDAEAEPALRERLVPRVTVLTPNVDEAVWLAGGGMPRRSEDLPALARRVRALGPRWVLLKGGHAPGRPGEDVLAGPDGEILLRVEPLDGPDPRGTGCALASLLAAGLAAGLPVPEATRHAQVRLLGARAAASRVGTARVLGWSNAGTDGAAEA